MKIKSQLTLAAIIVAGMFATGCQQMQQTAGGASQQTATTETTGTGGSTAGQACDPKADKNCHHHPEAPDCAMSKWHSHPYNDPNHKHTYGCVAGQKKAVTVPKVKAKGNYKGPVTMDNASQATMQQYQR
ncbi:hypothetical protein [Candidatus Thiothrix anitrata]|uniref:Lipoprotein n=1 Tax=Candidatus Thiothrix anitrata TaxID=2823902 RepID=A0ABX7X5T3_9GAMM|nr:hypothetical protein [Candidatus Thiothrix anitrata]QTR50188.1 hypothetical protein J8380_00960 [Candidatus Thiothrix anitrata]